MARHGAACSGGSSAGWLVRARVRVRMRVRVRGAACLGGSSARVRSTRSSATARALTKG